VLEVIHFGLVQSLKSCRLSKGLKVYKEIPVLFLQRKAVFSLRQHLQVFLLVSPENSKKLVRLKWKGLVHGLPPTSTLQQARSRLNSA
jgi:hypothetical protein